MNDLTDDYLFNDKIADISTIFDQTNDDRQIFLISLLNKHLYSWNNQKIVDKSRLIIENFIKINKNFDCFYDYFNNGLKNDSNRIKLTRLQFKNLVENLKFDAFTENLVDLAIKAFIAYIEDYDYEQRIKALDLLDHLVENCIKTQLSFNNRALFIFSFLNRYLHDKDSPEFLKRLLHSTLKLLDIIESKYTSNEHQYKLHSEVFEGVLNNCYLSTQTNIKLIYYDSIQEYTQQIGVFLARHLTRYYQVAFECFEHIKGVDLNTNFGDFSIFIKCFDLIKVSIDLCKTRIHVHAQKIVNFLLKLLYYCSISNENHLEITQKIINILKYLFSLEKCSHLYLDELKKLRNIQTNEKFESYIDCIINNV